MKFRSIALFFLPLSLLVPLMITSAQVRTNSAQPGDPIPALSEAQKEAIERIKVATEKRAAPVALRFAGIVTKVYDNMLADKPNEKLRVQLSTRMKATAWELLTIKGQAIRETVNVLTPEQKQFIKSEMLKPGAPGDLSEVIEKTFGLRDK